MTSEKKMTREDVERELDVLPPRVDGYIPRDLALVDRALMEQARWLEPQWEGGQSSEQVWRETYFCEVALSYQISTHLRDRSAAEISTALASLSLFYLKMRSIAHLEDDMKKAGLSEVASRTITYLAYWCYRLRRKLMLLKSP